MAEADDNQIPFKPYILRAMIDWCEDNVFEPYLLTQVDDETVVPREFVQDGKITLSVASEAVHNPDFGNDEFRFDARFGEASRQIVLPVRAIIAAYPAEHPESAIGFPYEPPTAAPEAQEGKPAEAKRPTLIQKIK